MTTQEINKRVTKPTCKDGKRHWWKAGWVCEKCGLRKADYVENRREEESMTTTEINKRFAELTGICWPEYDNSNWDICIGSTCIDKSRISHPDVCKNPDLVLEAMMKRKYFGDFVRYIYGCGDDVEYEVCIPLDLILDKTGKLALAAIKWMEEKE